MSPSKLVPIICWFWKNAGGVFAPKGQENQWQPEERLWQLVLFEALGSFARKGIQLETECQVGQIVSQTTHFGV